MKASFIVDLDIQDDTDFIGIADDLKDSLNENFQYACLNAKPFPREATKPLGGITPPQQPGGLLPPTT